MRKHDAFVHVVKDVPNTSLVVNKVVYLHIDNDDSAVDEPALYVASLLWISYWILTTTPNHWLRQATLVATNFFQHSVFALESL